MKAKEDRAEKLQSALDRVGAGETVESVLARLGDEPDLADDLRFALQLGEALPADIRPDARAAIQVTLQDMMSSSGRAPSVWRRLVPRVAAVAAAAALVLWSAVVVSADSLPGDALYGVKLAKERTELALAVDPAARASVYLDMADERLSELATMVDLGLPLPASLLDDLVEAQEGAIDEASLAGDDELAHAAKASAGQAGRAVSELAELASPESRGLLESASSKLVPTAQDRPLPPPKPHGAPATPTPSPPAAPNAGSADPEQTVEVPAGASPAPATWTVPVSGTPAPTPDGASQSVSTSDKPTLVPPSPVATQTSEPPHEATLPPKVEAQFTQRAIELTEESRPTPTFTPRPRRDGRDVVPTEDSTEDPTEEVAPSPVASPGEEATATTEPPSAPPEQSVEPPTATIAP